MTLQQLKYLVAVAECGNISEAAQRLFISQPSMTTAIHNLEEELNIKAFSRTNKGVVLTNDGEELLSYARQLLEQANVIKEKFSGENERSPKFSVSCQHYSFAVNAFVDVIRQYESKSYDFTIRETQTHEIIDDVSSGKSELGILYVADHNEEVLSKLFRKTGIEFRELYVASPHIFISSKHPLANNEYITVEELQDYPYLTFEQGEYNSFYFSEEFLSTLDFKKNIMVRDRATLFNLLIGLNGFTVCSGIIDAELNGDNIIAKPLQVDCKMRIGVLTKKNIMLSRYALSYLESLDRQLK